MFLGSLFLVCDFLMFRQVKQVEGLETGAVFLYFFFCDIPALLYCSIAVSFISFVSSSLSPVSLLSFTLSSLSLVQNKAFNIA